MSEDKKYKGLSPKEVREDIRKMEEAKTKYSMEQVDVEKALTEY